MKRSRLQSQRRAQPAELGGDGAARIGLPFPDPGQELLAVQQLLVGVRLRLRPRPRRPMPSCSRLRTTTICVAMPAWSVPGRHSTSSPFIRRQRISTVLQRVVERVPHVQAARDVGRRDDDAIRRLGRSRMGLERAALLPFRVAAGFDLLGVVGLVEH